MTSYTNYVGRTHSYCLFGVYHPSVAYITVNVTDIDKKPDDFAIIIEYAPCRCHSNQKLWDWCDCMPKTHINRKVLELIMTSISVQVWLVDRDVGIFFYVFLKDMHLIINVRVAH